MTVTCQECANAPSKWKATLREVSTGRVLRWYYLCDPCADEMRRWAGRKGTP